MQRILHRTITLTVLAAAVLTTTAFARPVTFTQEFPGGFNVSINGGGLAPSGPITVTGIVDDATPDIDPSSGYGEFPLTNVTFNGAGFVNRTVITPLSLITFSFSGQNFAFQRLAEFNRGIIGWNGSTLSGPFITDVNDLSTLVPLPYTTVGTSTFWYDALGANSWTLDLGGDTIGANLGIDGQDGIFSITAVPEPSAFALLGVAGIFATQLRRKRTR